MNVSRAECGAYDQGRHFTRRLASPRIMPAIVWLAMLFAALVVCVRAQERAREEDESAEAAPSTPAPPDFVLTSVRPTPTTTAGLFQRFGVTRSDLRSILDQIDGLERVIAMREVRVTARRGERELEARLVGIQADAGPLPTLAAGRGRFVDEMDVLRRRNVAVLGHAAAATLFPTHDPLGKTVRIESHYFVVAGVAEEGDEVVSDDVIFVPLTTMKARMGDRRMDTQGATRDFIDVELTRVEMTLRNRRETRNAMWQIRAILAESHSQEDYSLTVLP